MYANNTDLSDKNTFTVFWIIPFLVHIEYQVSYISYILYFDSDLHLNLDTEKNNLNFPIYSLFHSLAEVCTLRVLFFTNSLLLH